MPVSIHSTNSGTGIISAIKYATSANTVEEKNCSKPFEWKAIVTTKLKYISFPTKHK